MSAALAKRLFEQRNRLVVQARAITDKVDAEERDLTVEERTAWDQIDTELRSTDTRLAEVLEADKRSADADAAFRDLRIDPEAEAPADQSAPTVRSLLAAGKPIDLRSGGQLKPGWRNRGMDFDARALSKGTATAGGNTVKTSFYDRLVDHLIEVSGVMMAGPTMLNTDSGEVIQVSTTTAHSTATIIGEGSAISASDPAFTQRALGAYKYAILLQLSNELITDTSVDLEGYLAMELGRALGNGFGGHAITGTGTGQPTGIVTSASTGVTGGAGVAGAFTADNLIDLHFSVIAPYRNSKSCAWVMKDSSLGNLRKLKDSAGYYLFQPAMTMGAPDMLLGKPIVTDPFVAPVGLSAKSVIFGDFSRYFVRMVNGIRLERSNEFAFNTDQVTWRAILRADGITVDQTGALKVFTGNAA
ncbi:MAG: phage major capsid protein family [Frankiales bacterium]|nr:phage major capsid protein family [Frankiales bacterium]